MTSRPTTRIPLRFALGLHTAENIRYGKKLLIKEGTLIKPGVIEDLPSSFTSKTVSVISQGDIQQIVNSNMAKQDNEDVDDLVSESKTYPPGYTLFKEGDTSSNI